MSSTTILDRIVDDYEGLRPVEYAIRPSPKKIAEIERIMGGVRKKVNENSVRAKESFRKRLPNYGYGGDKYLETKNVIQDFMNQVYNDPNSYAMAISRENLGKVLNRGDFENQFATGKSGGEYNEGKRAYISNKNFGTPLERLHDVYIDKKANPKYNWIDTFTDDLFNSEKYGFVPGYGDGDMIIPYGEYIVNFYPQNVKDRTTFSNGDSMMDYDYPVLLSDDNTWGGLVNHLSDNPDLYDITNLDENAFNRLKHRLRNPFDYNELQYHGPLGVDDIKSVTIPSYWQDAFKERIETAKSIWPNDWENKLDDKILIPERWKQRANENRFDFIDEDGNIIYQGNK